jgi:hypothetical protein
MSLSFFPSSHIHNVVHQIVEELEDRLPDKMDDILSCVKTSLVDPPTDSVQEVIIEQIQEQNVEGLSDADGETDDAAVVDEMVFDDTGEGAGVEGDLDMEED